SCTCPGCRNKAGRRWPWPTRCVGCSWRWTAPCACARTRLSWQAPRTEARASGLSDAEAGRAQVDGDLDFLVHGVAVLHGVEALIEVGQQAQAVLEDVGVGLDAGLVLVETQVGVQAGHADVDAGSAVDVVGVAEPELVFLQHVAVQLDDVDVVVGSGHQAAFDGKQAGPRPLLTTTPVPAPGWSGSCSPACRPARTHRAPG